MEAKCVHDHGCRHHADDLPDLPLFCDVVLLETASSAPVKYHLF
jgi:hypothetical protein